MKRKLIAQMDWDPRPLKRIKCDSYASSFNNACINYQAAHCSKYKSYKMQILQLIPPANVYAVANDHDYFEQPEKRFLEALSLANVSAEQAALIQEKTIGQNRNQEWFAERRKRMCSSRFSRLCLDICTK